MTPAAPELRCADHCLFNVVEDVGEQHDLKEQKPELVQELLTRLDQYAGHGVPRNFQPGGNEQACAVVQSTGYWQPYQDGE